MMPKKWFEKFKAKIQWDWTKKKTHEYFKILKMGVEKSYDQFKNKISWFYADKNSDEHLRALTDMLCYAISNQNVRIARSINEFFYIKLANFRQIHSDGYFGDHCATHFGACCASRFGRHCASLGK